MPRPTREQYMAYVLSLVGYYGAGAGLAENDTPFNTKYYGRRVSGPRYSWCRVGQWFVDDHFGMAEENGGKSAYVPANVRGKNAKIWHRPKHGSPAYEPGNKVNFDFNDTNEAEHTEFYWKARNTTSFWTVGFNTGNDQVAKRIRYFKDVLDVMETVGFASSGTSGSGKGDEVPDYVSLGTRKPVPVKMGEVAIVNLDLVISDKEKRHTGEGPGIFVAGKNGSVYVATVTVEGPATFELCEMRKEGDEWKQHDHSYGGLDLADAGSHLWLKLHPVGDGVVTVGVKCAVWDR